MTVSALSEQLCDKSDNINNVITTVNKLFHIYSLQLGTRQAVRTQLVDGLLADLLHAIGGIFASIYALQKIMCKFTQKYR
jgi:hypothetical protein